MRIYTREVYQHKRQNKLSSQNTENGVLGLVLGRERWFPDWVLGFITENDEFSGGVLGFITENDEFSDENGVLGLGSRPRTTVSCISCLGNCKISWEVMKSLPDFMCTEIVRNQGFSWVSNHFLIQLVSI